MSPGRAVLLGASVSIVSHRKQAAGQRGWRGHEALGRSEVVPAFRTCGDARPHVGAADGAGAALRLGDEPDDREDAIDPDPQE